jgi:MoxR-like ATPase
MKQMSYRKLTEAPAAPKGGAKAAGSTVAKTATSPTKIFVGSASLDNRTKQLHAVMDNMSLSHGTGLLLAGSTGIGKTTFVKQLGRLLGMPVVLVEAPHITEEHLINIPFIVFDPVSKSSQTSSVNVSSQNFHVQLGQSHLASELGSIKAVPDARLLAAIKSADANMRQLWSNLGGDENTIPQEVAELRSKYRVILFLDEYFRQTSANVRNILRGILNGRIGNDRIPAGTYVIYASNLTDVGQTIEEIPLNADFKKINYQPPNKEEFLHYLVSRFEADTKVALKPDVIAAFDKALSDEHISYDDAATEIRTSPRRWEQIMLYVNASVPVTNSHDAAALLSNVKAMFTSGEETSSLWKITESAVRSIIAATSGEDFANVNALGHSQWRSSLQHQIETKIKLGDARTYVPVVAGMPGIGKTAQAIDVAQKMNMLLIHIDCSTLTVDEITGIPIPSKTGDGHKMAVKFSEPSLYQRIIQDIEEDTAAMMSDPSVSADRKAAFAKQPYKYLIFFDELNRVKSANVFNSLRRVILEKSFNDQTHLPKESIVIAAMNPYDKGTVELTGHLKDATDYLDTSPSWSSLVKYLESGVLTSAKLARYNDQSRSIAMEIVRNFAETFAIKKATSKIDADSRRFYIKMGDDNVYISPREYTTMLQDLVAGVDRVVKKAQGMDVDTYQQALFEAAWAKISHTLEWILDKHQVDSPQFLGSVKSWLRQFSAKFLIKSRDAASLDEMLDTVLSDPSKHLKDDVDFVNYVNNFELNRFAEDFENYLGKILKVEKRPADAMLVTTHPGKTLEKGKVKISKDMVSKVEYLVNEFKHAAEVHNLSGDLTDRMEQSIIAALSEFIEQLDPDEMSQMLEKVKEIVGGN